MTTHMTADQLHANPAPSFTGVAPRPDYRRPRDNGHGRMGDSGRLRSPALRRGLAAMLGLLLVCGTAAWLWPQAAGAPSPLVAGLVLARDAPPVGPIGVEKVSVPLLWTGPVPATAMITVANSTLKAQTARVWWILGRYGDRAPWRDPILESAHTDALVAAHSSITVSASPATGARLPADGIYVLTLWVHTVRPDGTEVHSDGVAVASPVTIASLAATVRETVVDPASPARVTVVDAPARARAGAALTLSSQVGNQSSTEVSIQFEMAASNSLGATVHSAPVSMVLDPGAPVTIPARLTLPTDWRGPVVVEAVVSTLLPDGQAVPAVVGARARSIAVSTD